MADGDGEIKVVIDPAIAGESTPEVKPVVQQPDKPAGDVVVKTGGADPVKELAQQYADMQKRDAEREAEVARHRQEAEESRRKVMTAQREAAEARKAALTSDLGTITTGIEAAKGEADAAEAEYKTAMEAGDFEKVAKAQRRMSRAEAQLTTLERDKADFEDRQKTLEQQANAPTSTGDALEDFIATKTPQTAAWLRDHKDWVTDPRKANMLSAAHFHALGNGLRGDTPEYFDHVEEYIGLKKGAEPAPAPRTRPRAPPVAPVANSGNGGVQGGGVEVRLSQSEALAATDGTHVWNYDDPSGQKKFRKGEPIGIQEFARRKQAMTASGQYDRAYLEQ